MRLSISKYAIMFGIAAATLSASTSHALKWWEMGQSQNVVDCRSGWYCTSGGGLDLGASWDHVWSPYFWWL
ncbi:MAG TPA: hypothetical protein VFV50_14570 [Bdellovibrionales bacterium]|nr:hypothetical protein [Bdellovibrionales bacterium]